MSLQSNVVSHWLIANLESALIPHPPPPPSQCPHMPFNCLFCPQFQPQASLGHMYSNWISFKCHFLRFGLHQPPLVNQRCSKLNHFIRNYPIDSNPICHVNCLHAALFWRNIKIFLYHFWMLKFSTFRNDTKIFLCFFNRDDRSCENRSNLIEKKGLDYFIILYNQGHGCWCPGYIQSQGISITWTTADSLSIVSTLRRHESIICACISVLSRLNHNIGYLIFDITRYTVTRHLKGNTICIHILLRQQLTSI